MRRFRGLFRYERTFMFFTRPEYSEWLPPLEGYRNCSGWGTVEMAARLPWYLMEVSVRDERGYTVGRRTLLISRMTTLADALKSMGQAKNVSMRPYRILAFYPPGWDEACDTWSSREIVEVWAAQLEQDEAPNEIWLLKPRVGQEFVEPDIDGAPQVRKVRPIFVAHTEGM